MAWRQHFAGTALEAVLVACEAVGCRFELSEIAGFGTCITIHFPGIDGRSKLLPCTVKREPSMDRYERELKLWLDIADPGRGPIA
jgi:hypothetical protein